MPIIADVDTFQISSALLQTDRKTILLTRRFHPPADLALAPLANPKTTFSFGDANPPPLCITHSNILEFRRRTESNSRASSEEKPGVDQDRQPRRLRYDQVSR